MSPWQVLGVDEWASVEEIRAAYRAACRLYHPDHFAGAPDALRAAATKAMQDANAAHDVLVAAVPRWAPRPTAGKAVERYRPRNRWDEALAPTPARGRYADLAA